MVYYTDGKFKRYVKRIKNKSKNAKAEYREVEQLTITGLSKDTEFMDKQRVIIIDYDVFNDLLNNYNEQEQKLLELTKSLEDAELTITEMENKINATTQTDSRLISLYERLEQKNTIIDNQKNILLQANETVNTLFDQLAKELLHYYDDELSKINKETENNIKTIFMDINEQISSVSEQILEHNQTIEQTNRFKLALSKNTFKIDIAGIGFDVDTVVKEATKSFSIDFNTILDIINENKTTLKLNEMIKDDE